MRSCGRVLFPFVLVFALSMAVSAQTAEFLIWRLPTPDALPSGIAIAPGGKVYIAEFRAQKIGRLDPGADELAERDVGGSPGSIYAPAEDAVVYSLPMDDAIEYLVFTSGGARWRIPTPGAWPQDLTPAPAGPGRINLWFAERTAGKVALLAPAQIAVTLPLIYPDVHPVAPERRELSPDVIPVTPTLHPGNPMLPPPIALITSVASDAITEWDVLGNLGGVYVEDLALAPDGQVWFTTSDGALDSLDPDSNTALFYTLPTGTRALGVAVAADGTVWFTDVGTAAIGALDPATGDVRLWNIPGGVQPLKLVAAAPGRIWFVDREGDLAGFLRPDANEFVIYRLPPGSYPVDLALGDDGTAWFVCERGNYVASLAIVPVLGPPPAAPGTDAARILGYSITQSGNHATVEVIYSYDGSLGFPAYVGLYVLPDGTGFGYVPYRIARAGTGVATIELTYSGAIPVRTEGIKLVIYLPGGQVIAERVVDFRATWSP